MSESNDLVFDKAGSRFNYRTVGVFIDRARVLLHKVGTNPYWSLPGGRVEFHESSIDAIRREMDEELGQKITVVRPLWATENFFTNYGGKCHEVAFYFLCELPAGSYCLTSENFIRIDGTTPLHFGWHSLDLLKSLPLFPSFLRSSLLDLPATMGYIVHRDEIKQDIV